MTIESVAVSRRQFMHRLLVGAISILWLLVASCSDSDPSSSQPQEDGPASLTNPLLQPASLPFEFPPFDRIRAEHFPPAFRVALDEQLAQIETIAGQSAPPDFENTVVALEVSGQTLNRISALFDNQVITLGGNDLLAIQQRLQPLLAAQDLAIAGNDALFRRLDSLLARIDELGLDPEQQRLLRAYHLDFRLAGAGLDRDDRQRLRDIDSEIRLLEVVYSGNALDLNARLAEELALAQPGFGPLALTTRQPALARIDDREARRRIHLASIGRGWQADELDNRETLVSLLALRAERARLLGFESHAALRLARQSIGGVAAVKQLIQSMLPLALETYRAEIAALETRYDESLSDEGLRPWDWEFLLAKRSGEEGAASPNGEARYELERVLEQGVFGLARRLFGVEIQERFDLPAYSDDVRVFELRDVVGSPLGLVLLDPFARPDKQPGAWTNVYVTQSTLLASHAVAGVHLGLDRPPQDMPALLDLEQVETLFHEFGHAWQALFSDVRYPYFSGIRVEWDRVEYLGQVFGSLARSEEVIATFAPESQAGEPITGALQKAPAGEDAFGQGFDRVEILAAAWLDISLHSLSPEQIPSAGALESLERELLRELGIDPEEVMPRYRSTYFLHLAGGFDAGYYSYLWADLLEADTLRWFSDNGGLTRSNGGHLRQTLLSPAAGQSFLHSYREFRGGEPEVEALTGTL